MKKCIKKILCLSSYLIALSFPNLSIAQNAYCQDTINYSFDDEAISGTNFAENGHIEATNSTVPVEAHFKAGTYILLKPDFHVPAGAIFSAKIEDCVASKPFITIPAANAIMDNGCLDNSDPISWYCEWNEVENATSYQIRVRSPFFLHPIFEETVSTNYYTYNRSASNVFSNNQLDRDFVAEVRANVNDAWTPWYGHEGAAALPLTIEPIGTDCPPLMTAPLPQATLDNGCNGFNETINWNFAWTAVPGASEYQLIVKHPSVSINTINQTVTTNSYNFNAVSQINTYFTGWTVKVRAKIQGIWTDYHGSTLDEEVMLFNVEQVDTDCAPLITKPSPQATLANGCLYPESNQFEWEIKIAEKSISEENEIRIRRSDGSIYTSNNVQIITIEDEGNDTITYIYRIYNEFIPADELENWAVQVRSKINGTWTTWYGHTLNISQTNFKLEAPNTTCAPLITSHLPDAILDNGCINGETVDDWYFEWNEVPGATDYQFYYGTPSFTDLIPSISSNNYTVSIVGNIPNTLLEDWRAAVRAFKDGQWTNWYGTGLIQELNFSVEPLNTDCPQWITSPVSQAVLDNGCKNVVGDIDWTFNFSADVGATENQLLVKRPDGSIYFDEIIDGSISEFNYASFGTNTFIDENELNNWSVQMRSKVDGLWLPWRGDSPTSSILYFNVELPDTDCAPLITTPLPNTVLDNGCDGSLNNLDWHFEWTPVSNATEYQLLIKHPSISANTFDETVSTNSWTYSQIDRISNLYAGWTAKVRAKVNGVWTEYYGSTLEEETMTFDVEVKNTDCAPLVLLPTPNDVLDNGCESDPSNQVIWTFKNKELEDATHYEIRVLDPDNTPFLHYGNEGYRDTWKYYFSHTILPTTNLLGWSVQFRAKLNDLWSPWYGHAFNVTRTYFSLEPLDTDCPNLVNDEVTSRNRVKTKVLNQSVGLKVYPNPFQQETTIEYTVSKPSNVQLAIYTLTGKLVTVLTQEQEQPVGSYSTTFKAKQDLPLGMYLARLQVGEEIQFKKIMNQ